MLVITKQSVENLINGLDTPSRLEQCQDEIRQMLEIESELLWWSESGKCCRWQATDYFTGKVQLLKDTLKVLEDGNVAQASLLLKEYANKVNEDKQGIMLG